ncbi:BAF_HP2_G0006270.mRNA.1.CDS.1 [Saccharomyces cerevisiae]|nr:BAF_HP2_G0006270.mRNA.1.CDS.1 [Saccharomyces cerevisiae]CAI6415102.1 BAF_HP2_G0006270.mRNA.1.CDS.1 [Saccharomyces cerevisiae]
MKSRKLCDQIVISTKFTTDYKGYDVGKGKSANYCGNHKRSLHVSVRDSLRKLQTDWIDILYVHWWDYMSSIEEVMDSLHILVQQGKVLYLGVSDTPAWVVPAANYYATSHGKTPFSVYQGKWNLLNRDFERDIIPMARHFGMASPHGMSWEVEDFKVKKQWKNGRRMERVCVLLWVAPNRQMQKSRSVKHWPRLLRNMALSLLLLLLLPMFALRRKMFSHWLEEGKLNTSNRTLRL